MLMALGRKNILQQSVLQQIWRNLWLKTIFVMMKRMLRIVWNFLGFMKSSSLHHHLLSNPENSQPSLSACWAFFTDSFVPRSDAVAPTDDGHRDYTLQNRLIEDMQHPAANTEGPKCKMNAYKPLTSNP